MFVHTRELHISGFDVSKQSLVIIVYYNQTNL